MTDNLYSLLVLMANRPNNTVIESYHFSFQNSKIMKTAKSFFLILMLIAPLLSFSQMEFKTMGFQQPILKNEWKQADNWLQTLRSTFGKDIGTNWMSELAMEGEFYLNTDCGGFIVLLPKYIQSDAKMHAKFQYGIYENKNTRLLPLSGETEFASHLNTTRLLGNIGGVPATLDIAVVDQGGKFLTIMGFYPGNEISNDFSKKFQQMVEQNYGGRTFASR